MAASSRRKPRARRSAPARPTLEQRHWDLIGLGLVALAVFLAFLVYLGWEGGTAGTALVDGLKDMIGAVHVVAPAALLAAGAVLVLRPVLPAVRPFRAAALCLLLSSCLALAAGTFGLGGGSEAKEDRGGQLGTGASSAGVLKATGDSVTTTSRRVRERAEPVRSAVTMRMRTAREELAELETSEFTAVRARRERKREPGKEDFWSGADRFPDLYAGDRGSDPLSPPDEPAAGETPQPPVESRIDAAEPDGDRGSDSLSPRLAEDPETGEPGVTRAGRDVKPEELTPAGRYRASVTDSPEFEWTIPDPRFLTRSTADASRPDTVGQEKTAAQLIEALGHFGVQAKVIGMVAGPHITRYELRLAPGIKVGKVAQLKDDLAYALAASDIRILAPIPGKQAVGVEVPNVRRRIVHLGDVFQEPPGDWSPLTVWLGKDVAGRAIGADLAKMPHLLVAGTTGAGKSGAVNAMLSSILLRATPHEVRMVLVDPKQVELNHYDSIPHLLTPVITSPRQAATALQNLVREMEQRYGLMSIMRTRSLVELNRRREERGEARLPYVLCVIDELADLMMVAPADVEDAIIRLAQKARAVGIHLVLATQSPRVDVITGMIKANVPSRIAFAVSSQTDSRVILDQNGAETLLG